MFLHMYKYKLKSMLCQKEDVFWIILFPIILGTFFYLAFAKISSRTENFNTIDIAVVEENSSDEANSMFNNMIENLQSSNGDNVNFFNVHYVDAGTASDMLGLESVTAVITMNEGIPSLVIRENGIYETMVKCVIDSYLHICTIIGQSDGNPDSISEVIRIMSEEADNITGKKLTDGNTDNMTNYFYALIAMACMFATLSGQSCATGLCANLSSIGMRKSLSPGTRTGMVLSEASAAFTMHIISDFLLIVYLRYILRINLGGDFFHIYLIMLFGSMIAMCIGIMTGSIHRLSEGAKIGINISIALVSSFMSDLMVSGIKNNIEKHIPILNRINPSTLISDALYALNIYDDYKVYTNRLIIMALMSLVFVLISFFITRRERYDSI